MARRKRRTSGRRRRRISGVALSATSPLVKYGSLAGGYFLADKINEQLVKITGTLDPKIVNGVLAAGGLYYMFMHKGKKNTALTVVSGLAAGTGIKGLLTEFGVVSGFREMPVLNGYQNVPTVGKYAIPSGGSPSLSGIPGGNGYRVPAPIMGSVPDEYSNSGINPTDR